jgi:hypothetical protein
MYPQNTRVFKIRSKLASLHLEFTELAAGDLYVAVLKHEALLISSSRGSEQAKAVGHGDL